MADKHPRKTLTVTRITSNRRVGSLMATASPRRRPIRGEALGASNVGRFERWVLRTMVRRERRDIGLGGLKLVSLAETREKAAELRRMAREGGDPLAERRKTTMGVPTVKEAANTVYESDKAAWKNPKHVAQRISSMEAYCPSR